MQKYQMKRKEKLFPVFVELQNSRCSKCGMELPLAAQSRLTGGGTIECDNCHHVIYKN
jgi:predicted  nucleic acid-binding Zn-ribbon protein